MAHKSLIHNVFANGILSIFNILLPLIVTPYVYRILGPGNIGSFEYSNAIFGYFSILGLLGIYDYGVRAISSNRDNNYQRDYIFKNLLSIGLISNLIILLLYFLFIYFFLENELIKTISYILCLNLFSQIFQVEWFNVGMEEFKFITTKTIFVRTLNVTGIFLFIHSKDDILIYSWFTVGTLVINYLISFIYVLKIVNRPLRFFLTDLDFKSFIVPLLIILILKNTSVLYTLADRLILGYVKGAESVAFFSIGQRIIELTKALLMSIVFATIPRLSYYLKTNRELYQSSIIKVIRLIISLSIPVGIGLFLMSSNVVIIFGGESFAPASLAMRIFSLRIILSCLETIMYSQILFLHGKEKRLMIYNVLCGILNLGLNLLFIDILTPFISILCTFLSEIVFNILMYMYIRNVLHIRTDIFKFSTFRYFLITILFIPIVLLVRRLNNNNVVELCISGFCCSTLYFSILAVIKDKAYIELKDYTLKIFFSIYQNINLNKK